MTQTALGSFRPIEWGFKTPQAMVEQLKAGRYAARPDSNTPYTFIRIARPTFGKNKGNLLIQSQHSDAYKTCAVIYPSGRVYVTDRRIDQALLLVAIDPMMSAIRYGQELGRCSSCGKKLTDERSRWYSIGPECEKRWTEIIENLDEKYGPWFQGKERVA